MQGPGEDGARTARVFVFVAFLLRMWVCVRWSFLSYHLILSKEGGIENEMVYKTLFLMVGNS